MSRKPNQPKMPSTSGSSSSLARCTALHTGFSSRNGSHPCSHPARHPALPPLSSKDDLDGLENLKAEANLFAH